MFGFFILCMLIFAVVAIFLPEWLGITGAKAKEIQNQQIEGSDATQLADPSWLSDSPQKPSAQSKKD
jgi:hypothetical protein